MSFSANITRDSVGNIIIRLSGHLEYQYSVQLQDNLEDIYISYPETDIRLDMSGINFVGSSGISHFVDTLKTLNLRLKKVIQLSNVHLDFKRVFLLYNLDESVVQISNFSLRTELDENLDSSAA